MMTRCALRLPRGGAFRSAASSPSVRRLWSTVAPTASARPVAPPAALHTPVCTQHLTPLAPGRPVRCAVDLRALSRRQQLRFSLPSTSSSSSAALSTDATTVTDETSGNGVSASGAGEAQGPTFQEAVQRLQNYWASVGCAIWLPHNTEVGAGTMNPATFLRVLGPEPWNVAYPEPSVRPDDSRYGDNPNRVQRHTQYQVILKPDPGNPQELYLGSLAALGIDTSAHDVRFVEDNWESPVLGAWGLGWEVWLDGMEVTQFTYFQQAGGQPLVVPAVEITYGLERILMSLQGVNHFKDIRYNETMTYGEMFLQNEYEMSVYNLDEADVEGQRQRFDLFVAEAHRLLDKRLPIPAYDHLLKTSHAFNILDARGAIGVTERAKCFADMRALARRVTQLWGERREEQGFPLGRVQQPEDAVAGAPNPEHLPAKGGVAPFVLEIGSEELPPADVEAAMAQLRAAVPGLFAELKLEHGGVTVEGTPRRLVVMVDSLAAFTKDVEQRLRGPPAKAAFKDGEPTKALQGFARKNGVEVADVVVEVDAKGVEYCYAEVSTAGRPAAEALAVALGELIKGLSFKKSMRWNGGLAYSRPLRWVLAMHGPAVVPLVVGDLTGGATTRLLRNAAETEATLGDAGEYGGVMGSAGIEVGFEARKVAIWSAVIAAAKEVGGIIPQSNSEELLLEVANLVEAPTVVRGTFDPSFLKLPRELLVMVMRKHQRYFPVTDPDTGDLMPFFVTVANGPIDPAAVAAGNEAVLRARFEDAVFFYESDLEKTLDEFTPALAGTMFQADLGTLLDKTTRVQALVKPLAELMSSTAVDVPGAVPVALRAASLAKADLATSTVMEMTALAGIMGRHYATLGGETEEVATAIWEAILPRNSGDELPASPAGILVSVADRLDSLVGLVAAGCAPSASTDPYALRRTAYAMLQTLVGNGIGVDLRAAASAAAELQPISVSEETLDTALDFVERRLEQLLLDRGLAAQAVRAALAERGSDPALAAETATDLSRFMADNSPALAAVMTSLARPIRIIRGKEVDPDWVVNPELFEQEEERGLWEAYGVVASKKSADMTLAEFLAVAEPLSAPVDAFFDKVFVMADDEKVRANRLALLQQVAALQDGVVDFSQLPGF